MNIVNEWVGELPDDARAYDGTLPTNQETPWVIVDKSAFASVHSIEVDFELLSSVTEDEAGVWAYKYWFNMPGSATPTRTPRPTASPTLRPGISPEFKAAMDSFEAFFDSYIDFMNRYETADEPLFMLADYLLFLSQYVEMMAALEAYGSKELTHAESVYYLELLNRINGKLMKAIP